MSDVVILGLGNPLRGDDGVGLAVLAALEGRFLPERVRLVDGGTGGLEITLELARARRAFVVDAARFGGAPGESRRFDLIRTELGPTSWGAGHAHGLGAAIELGRALKSLPDQLILYAVEPSCEDEPHRLSEPVAEAVPRVLEAILGEL